MTNEGRQVEFAYSTVDEPAGSADWHTGDAAGSPGEDGGVFYAPSLIVSDGIPVVCYIEARSQHQVMCAVAGSATPADSNDWTRYQLDANDSFIDGIDAAIVDGRPALAVMLNGGNDLKHYRATSVTPGSPGDWVTTTISTGTIQGPVSMCEVDGRPAVCYTFVDDLIYSHADSSTPAGPADWSYIAMPGPDRAGKHYSMAVIGGRPAIAYQRSSSMSYVFSDAAVPTLVEDWYYGSPAFSTTYGEWASLREVDGRPVVATYFADGESLGLIVACEAPTPENHGPGMWNIINVDDQGSKAGRWCSLAVQNDLPVVMYSISDMPTVDYDLRYARGY